MPKKKHARLGFAGQSNGFIALRLDLRDSQAFRTLSPLAQLVLIDILRIYQRASRGDTESLAGEGFRYTWDVCEVRIGRTAFYQCIKEIRKHGFVTVEVGIQEKRVCAPTWFLPSLAWEKYQPTRNELAREKKYKQQKEKAVGLDRRKRREYRARQYDTPETGNRGATKRQDTRAAKRQDRVMPVCHETAGQMP